MVYRYRNSALGTSLCIILLNKQTLSAASCIQNLLTQGNVETSKNINRHRLCWYTFDCHLVIFITEKNPVRVEITDKKAKKKQ